jgi:fructose-specific phosphotransferase system IIC component
MSESKNGKPSVWWGILGGMLVGFFWGVLRYLYEQWTLPSQYNGIYLSFLTPVLMIVCAIIGGLLIVAWLISE